MPQPPIETNDFSRTNSAAAGIIDLLRCRSILIFQLDGKIPNIACMRIAAHHRALGDSVAFRWTGSHIMVYMLIGYWPGETDADRVYRQAKLRDFGCRPYPMPFTRTPELVGFQRWVIGAYDKRITWAEWRAAGYRPENCEREAA